MFKKNEIDYSNDKNLIVCNTFNIASCKILLNNLLLVLILINISPSYYKNRFRVGIVTF